MNRWMKEFDSFLFPQKELRDCCHGDHLANLHLPIKVGAIREAKAVLSALCLQIFGVIVL